MLALWEYFWDWASVPPPPPPVVFASGPVLSQASQRMKGRTVQDAAAVTGTKLNNDPR